MTRIDFFLGLVAVSCGYAVLRGGKWERLVALLLSSSIGLSFLVTSPVATRYRHAEWGVMVIDVLLFCALTAVALKSERYWPSWLSALSFLEAASHLFAFAPRMPRLIYGIMMGIWMYPMLLILLAATWRHQRRRGLPTIRRS